MRVWAPAAVDQHEDFPQNSLSQQDVDPGVQDLVPGGHAYHHQETERCRLAFRSDAHYDDMDLKGNEIINCPIIIVLDDATVHPAVHLVVF